MHLQNGNSGKAKNTPMAQWVNVVDQKHRTWQENNTSQANCILQYKEQNGHDSSGLDVSQPQCKFIYNVKCPKEGQPSLVRNSSGQVNDTADDIIPFPVVDREQSQSPTKETRTPGQELRHARKETMPIVESFALLLFEGAPIRHCVLRLEARQSKCARSVLAG